MSVAAERVVGEGALRRQIRAVLAAWGFPGDAVDAATDALAWADLRGIASHGIAMLPVYEGWLRDGRFDVGASPRTVRESPLSALLDGGSGLGFAAARAAMRLAIDKARTTGLAAVAVRRSNHFGAAGHYAEMAAQAGLVGLCTTSTVSPAIVPTAARDACFGTNPIAFAAPGAAGPPFLLDMATSTVALGRLMSAAWRGEPVPTGWALDDAGRPTTDPQVGYRARRATPLGALPELSSHKGSGLAMMVEILSALLPGATPAIDDGGGRARGDVGHFMLALDPTLFRDDGGFGGALDALCARVRATAPVQAERPVRVAGDPERDALARSLTRGVALPATLAEALRGLAARAGCDWCLEADPPV